MMQRALSAVPRAAKAISKQRQFSALVSLDEEFPGLPATSPSPATASSPSVSTLPSGLTVVTEDASSSTTVTLTFPKAGSADEMLDEQGAALVNKGLAFNSGSGLSTMMIMRNIEDDGGMPFSSAGKFGATLGFTCPPENAARLAPLLATDCSFEKWDVRDARKLAATETEIAQSSAQVVLTEHLNAAAFGPQSAAGRPFYSASSVGLAEIQSFRSRAYGVNGAVLAVTGVADHASFVKAIEEGFSESPAGTPDAAASLTIWVEKADWPCQVDTHTLHLPLMLSGAASGVTGFSSKGLVGVYAGGTSTGELVDTLSTAVTSAGPELVARAKVLAKAEALFALDGGSKSLAEAMTASVVETGTFAGAAGVIAAYDAISDKEVDAAVSAMFKKTPALAAVGDITSVPYLGSIVSRFS
ncbi:Insulinase (Peptidase family M16) [Seminavis robusta]|uniref:Insulinase (Peptidase family M16) n=1 Tax=Seminavis robusta TaxID=568900 RepID=A0A9N8F1G0_9STRA|nr:Insulinase (Peptidase family M16) [Seminavis robusta]|eukprot:Sro3109_g343910.1 Insulinase (Peptidase family M16) (415) ;mRNA; r:2526-4100